MAVRIAVCDVGLGNLRSVQRALAEASRGRRVEVEITREPARVAAADAVVMPGQGAFGDCVRGLAGGLGDAVRELLRRGRPYLGICLGLQVLFGASEEAAGCTGLGVFDGRVVRLADGLDSLTGAALKIPHVGWNTADPSPARGLLAGAPQHFYFVHSYAVVPADPSVVAATTEYGERFVSAVARDNVFACQFHPEKSQRAGLALLERFLAGAAS
jgi:glutamine amidotransferase